jgi:hypothetical protein
MVDDDAVRLEGEVAKKLLWLCAKSTEVFVNQKNALIDRYESSLGITAMVDVKDWVDVTKGRSDVSAASLAPKK